MLSKREMKREIKKREHDKMTAFRQMFREYVQSIDGSARPTPADLLRDVEAYFREHGCDATRLEVGLTLDGTVRRLMPAVVKHVGGVLELEPLDKKIAGILNMEYYIDNISCRAEINLQKKHFDVFTPIGEQSPWRCDVQHKGYKRYSFLAKSTV